MNRKYWFWLNNIEGIGNIKIRRILDMFPDPETVFYASRDEIKNISGINESDINNILSPSGKNKALEKYNRIGEMGIKCVFPFEENYPHALKQIYDKPNILYYKGGLPDNNVPTVAVVGSRNCSAYGESVARELGRILAERGVNVISGMAIGIDRYAHEGALLAGGRTYAILAGGPDNCYPRQNYNLYVDIQRHGGVISEYGPNTKTVSGMFPARNRIISGMCDSVIVVEAARKSGSLITASIALEQNRRVFAVPGRICDTYSEGCNDLIRQGAEVVASYEGLLEAMGFINCNCQNEKNGNLGLAREEKMLYSLLLDFTPKSLDTLIDESGYEQSVVFVGLLGLELKGLIREVGKNFYLRI